MPYPTLAVDGLNEAAEVRGGKLELRPEDAAANEPVAVDTSIPDVTLGTAQLDVYGWEPSLWKKIKGYFGF